MHELQLDLFADPMVVADLIPEPRQEFGEVFTRRWVVELILDLVGYVPDQDLGSLVLVDPACGDGAFLLVALERLIESSRRHGRELTDLASALRAFDLVEANAARARSAVVERLQAEGVGGRAAARLAARWVRTADFLLCPLPAGRADFVVGNPPYIRLENVPAAVLDAYRRACPTMRGRSDVYVGFIEKGLKLLAPGGGLAYICADRWMHNQYGADLRAAITDGYAVEAVIRMHDADVFDKEVSAYPAIVVIRRDRQRDAMVVEAHGDFGPRDARQLTAWMRGNGDRADVANGSYEAKRLDSWFQGRDLWPAASPADLALISELEECFPPLEDPRTGTRVGIGVASGCDEVFITRDANLVEPECLLPLLTAADTVSGGIDWSGTYLVNPWNGEGLVELESFPRLAAYLRACESRLRARYVARQRPAAWYRTIDRVDPHLREREKLVFPDLKAHAHPVLDAGAYYPHHNLYYVVSEDWDLEVLGGILLSEIAELFVASYCVKMRGGTFRFQAQYLRRIRVPEQRSIGAADRKGLAAAFSTRDRDKATHHAARLYGVSREWGRRRSR